MSINYAVPIVVVLEEATGTLRHYVSFASPRGSLFLANRKPVPALQNCLTQLRKCISLEFQRFDRAEGEEAPHDGSIILCGRRLEISDADRVQLKKLNAALRPKGFEVRSYDWLLDASNITMNQIA
jgi:hypothetical protein